MANTDRAASASAHNDSCASLLTVSNKLTSMKAIPAMSKGNMMLKQLKQHENIDPKQ